MSELCCSLLSARAEVCSANVHILCTRTFFGTVLYMPQNASAFFASETIANVYTRVDTPQTERSLCRISRVLSEYLYSAIICSIYYKEAQVSHTRRADTPNPHHAKHYHHPIRPQPPAMCKSNTIAVVNDRKRGSL